MDRTTSDVGLRAQHHRLLARLHAVHGQQRMAAGQRFDPVTGTLVDVILDPLEAEVLRLMESDLVARLTAIEMELEHQFGSLIPH